ncbi:MAG TPA: glycosyltransferase family 9 protein [Vicinamibacteria bacterium]|nr:glycosyltransferase family 9 protein [Vicinamibacteria bacterium]
MARVLILRAGALGDILLLRRAVFALRRGGHALTLLAPQGPASALRGPGPCEVDDVIPWEKAEVAELASDAPRLDGSLAVRLRGFDAALGYTRSHSMIASLGRLIPQVIPWDPEPPSGLGHASRWLAQATTPLAAGTGPIPPVHAPSAQEAGSAAPWLARLPAGFLALHPGSGSPRKNWPAEAFAAAAQALTAGRPWLLVEGPADQAAAAALRSPNSVSAQALPPRVLGAILAQAGLFLGNDSGVSHLAAAWGAPTLALFGPTDPAVWGPVGPRVATLRSPTRSMADLSVEEVLAWAGKAAGPLSIQSMEGS